MPTSVPTVTDITDSSAVVMWTAAENPAENLQQYYKYNLEYRFQGESEWTVFSTLDHQPDSDGRQQHTLTDLRYDTTYEVQVTSVRTVRGDTDETEDTDELLFTTNCTGTVSQSSEIGMMSFLYGNFVLSVHLVSTEISAK